jgi:hypothetical protein
VRRREYKPQERIGINAVEKIVVGQMKWIWREQTVTDFGIDGHIETLGDDGRPSGKLFAVQIKSGRSYFRGSSETLPFYVDDDHIRYWDQHSLPTILVLYNPDDDTTCWQWADLRAAQATVKGWRIDVPRRKALSAESKPELQDQVWSDDSLGLRRRFALDRHLMEEFENRDAFVSIDKWLNKHLQYREIKIYFGEPKSDVAYVIPITATWNYEVREVLRHFLPWLDCQYYEEPDDWSAEVEGHLFSAQLSDAAKGLLATERFFENPTPVEDDSGDESESDVGNVSWAGDSPEPE